jgi:hypothetical protein
MDSLVATEGVETGCSMQLADGSNPRSAVHVWRHCRSFKLRLSANSA